jgi:hypothetical protein
MPPRNALCWSLDLLDEPPFLTIRPFSDTRPTPSASVNSVFLAAPIVGDNWATG